MAITKTNFGSIGGKEVYSFTLTNKNGTTAEILNYGGIVRKLIYKGVDVVLGRDSIEEYQNNEGYFAALIGRNSNRIAGAQFELNGKTYKLFANDGRNNLHGGKDGFDKKIWEAEMTDGDEPSLVLTTSAFDGEEGFPGNVSVKVTYTLTADNALVIHYEGQSDADTVLNMTNHAYFNLRGHAAGSIHDHIMTMYADTYAPQAPHGMVYGVLHPLPEEFDFRAPKEIGRDIDNDHEQLKLAGGYDHAWTVRNNGRELVTCTEVYCPESGINMTVKTNSPTVLLYTGNSLPGVDYPAKDGATYGRRGALCLETGFYPNCLKFPQFMQGYLKKGEIFDYETEYVFDVK